MKRFSKYLLAMLLPLTVLMVRPLTPAVVLMFGREIRLATEPVDPRDIFHGDYVTLRFSIEQVNKSLLSEQDARALFATRRRRDAALTLYVTLRPDEEGIWQPTKMSLTPPDAGIYLRARAMRGYYDEDVEIDYGDYLRRYYVKENTGRALETAAQKGELTAVVKVWRGRAVLTSVEEKR